MFLGEIAAVVQWAAIEAVIEPHYPKVGPKGGPRPFPLTDGNHVCANARGRAARLPLPKGPHKRPDNWYGSITPAASPCRSPSSARAPAAACGRTRRAWSCPRARRRRRVPVSVTPCKLRRVLERCADAMQRQLLPVSVDRLLHRSSGSSRRHRRQARRRSPPRARAGSLGQAADQPTGAAGSLRSISQAPKMASVWPAVGVRLRSPSAMCRVQGHLAVIVLALGSP